MTGLFLQFSGYKYEGIHYNINVSINFPSEYNGQLLQSCFWGLTARDSYGNTNHTGGQEHFFTGHPKGGRVVWPFSGAPPGSFQLGNVGFGLTERRAVSLAFYFLKSCVPRNKTWLCCEVQMHFILSSFISLIADGHYLHSLSLTCLLGLTFRDKGFFIFHFSVTAAGT